MFLKKAVLFLFFSASITLTSHEFSPAHLIMDEKMEANYEATWMDPIRSIGARASLIFPENCIALSQPPYKQGKYSIEKINLDCEKTIRGAEIKVVGLSVLNLSLIHI